MIFKILVKYYLNLIGISIFIFIGLGRIKENYFVKKIYICTNVEFNCNCYIYKIGEVDFV